ncbi:MAG: hypothetical protein GY759_00820 [Chloroflexi bacterium]|nr:hypothetical protein [Chloroflexota bacterium]
MFENTPAPAVLDKLTTTIPFNSSFRYVAQVDNGRCIGCGVCVAYCEANAATIGYGYLSQIDTELCDGCGVCAFECDFEAIAMTASTRWH